MFRDPHTGVECDISIHNALALRNTRLLRVYSMIDPRVRWLAYTLKRWVKARHLNDPSDSTLSSYGLLLLLFHSDVELHDLVLRDLGVLMGQTGLAQ